LLLFKKEKKLKRRFFAKNQICFLFFDFEIDNFKHFRSLFFMKLGV